MNVPLPIFLKIALKTPDVFASVARETFRSKTVRLLDHRFGRGKARPPRYIDIKMTNRCNLRCRMCGQWGEEGNFRDAPKETLRQELEAEVLDRLVEETKSFKPTFYLWGGEPFLSPALMPFVARIKEAGLVCAINTNGTFLDDAASDIIRLGVDNLLVSLDGPREVHDEVRGAKGTYDKVMAGVEKILALRRDARCAKPYITFVTTINKDNVERFPEVYDIAANAGVDFVGLQFGTFTTEESGGAYEARLRKALDCEAASWRGFLSFKTNLEVEKIQEGLRRIKAKKQPFGTYFIPDLLPEKLPAYYGSTSPLNGRRSCVAPWIRADILPNGDVYPCIDFPDYIVGNIHETPLMELWNGPRYVRFREELRRGAFSICARCCANYQF